MTAAVLGGGLLPGVPVTHQPGQGDAGLLPAGSSRVLRAESAEDEDRLTLDRLEQDGGELIHKGSTFHVRGGFTYHGERALRQVAVSMKVSEGISFTTEYSNCEYGEYVPFSPELRGSRQAVCLIDARVEPGESVDLAPVTLKAGSLAEAGAVDMLVGEVEKRGWSGLKWRDRHRGRGEELTLARRTGSVPPAARQTAGTYSILFVSMDNPWDLKVTGAALKGRKGETVTADLALDFHGANVRAQRSSENDEPFANVEVRLPKGVTVLSTPKHCRLTNSRTVKTYTCDYGLYTSGFDEPLLRDGFHVAYPFKLRIDDPSKLTGGRIRVVDAEARPLRKDADPKNNTAPITTGAADGSGATAWAVAASAAAVALTGLLAAALIRTRRARQRTG
ncbi:hypothetical protein [Streptomyces rhizosphaerihabitans]|uniref:hypothetical protein n=1 Tax=Streptomyces rhizosphaerihabitans TaxID=1266770 RepID=UPI0021C1C832|nr:hypothetical protein [Streptomyces rhizosphaerihabitans]MCT9004043.1 hypothetical protein [Streptomyces rhizosphaerihabitans]